MIATTAEKLAKLSGVHPNDWPDRHDILYKLENYEFWAEICEKAGQMTDDEILKIYFIIERINGLRRMKPFEPMIVKTLLREAEKQIGELGDHPSKSRLTELWRYHGGIVYDLLGNFKLAAKLHGQSAEVASSECRELLALYHQALALLKEAITTDVGIINCRRKFNEAGKSLLVVLTDSAEDRRQRGNVYWHRGLYDWIVMGFAIEPEKLAYLQQLKCEVVAFSEVVFLFQAISHIVNGSPMEALGILQKIDTAPENEIAGFKILLRASVLSRLGRQKEAEDEFNRVIQAECHGWHLAKAIANQDLSMIRGEG